MRGAGLTERRLGEIHRRGTEVLKVLLGLGVLAVSFVLTLVVFGVPDTKTKVAARRCSTLLRMESGPKGVFSSAALD